MIENIDKHILNAPAFHFMLLYGRYESFRHLFEYVDSQEEYVSLEMYAFNLMVSWARKRYYSSKSLLVVLNDNEFNRFLRDNLHLHIDSNLYSQLRKWFVHFNQFGWYHYLSSEDEILINFNENGLRQHRKLIANLNSLTEWSFELHYASVI